MQSPGDPASNVPPAPREEVPFDLTCALCGYNLRGLRAIGDCPECGAPVERSLLPNLISNADPRWLRRILLGAGCIWAELLFGGSAYDIRMKQVSPVLENTIRGMHILFYLLAVVGVYVLTTPNAFVPQTHRASRLRWALIIATAIAAAGRTANRLGVAFHQELLFWIGWWIATTLAIELHLLCRYFAMLAVNIPKGSLVKHARIAAWGLPLLLLSDFAFQLALTTNSLPFSTAGEGHLIIWFVCVSWYFALVLQLQLSLSAARERALKLIALHAPGRHAPHS
jgi:hypothetical protein